MRVVWQDDKGKPVPMSEPAVTGYLKGWAGTAEAEHPTDKDTDSEGWTEVSDTYRAPPKATWCGRAAPAVGTGGGDLISHIAP